jgi:anti-sigma B factor antagonist
VLDLQDLEFIDSTGLRVLLTAHERSRERGQEFAITPGSQQVQRLLSITRVDEHLRVIASPDELLV